MGKNLIISDYCYTFAATNTHATMKSPRLFFIFCHLLLGISIVSAKESDAIRRNQVGYYPQQEKVVVVEGVNPKDIAVLGRTNDEKASLNIISLNQKGGMRLLDTVATEGGDPCYVAENGRIALTANYSGGSMSVFSLNGRNASRA